MSELIIIGYDDHASAMAKFGGEVLRTSLSADDERELAEELATPQG